MTDLHAGYPVNTASPSLQPVASGERIALLDILRGFALLGILLMNIEGMAGPLMNSMTGVDPALAGIDQAGHPLARPQVAQRLAVTRNRASPGRMRNGRVTGQGMAAAGVWCGAMWCLKRPRPARRCAGRRHPQSARWRGAGLCGRTG